MECPRAECNCKPLQGGSQFDMVHLYSVFHKRISVADKEAVNSFAAVATIAFARIRSAIAPTEPDIGSLPEPNRVRQRERASLLGLSLIGLKERVGRLINHEQRVLRRT